MKHFKTRKRKKNHITIIVTTTSESNELVRSIKKVLQKWRHLLGELSYDVIITR